MVLKIMSYRYIYKYGTTHEYKLYTTKNKKKCKLNNLKQIEYKIYVGNQKMNKLFNLKIVTLKNKKD